MWTKKVVREDIAELRRKKYGKPYGNGLYIGEGMLRFAGKEIYVKEKKEDIIGYMYNCKEGWSWAEGWFEDGLKSKSEVI